MPNHAETTNPTPACVALSGECARLVIILHISAPYAYCAPKRWAGGKPVLPAGQSAIRCTSIEVEYNGQDYKLNPVKAGCCVMG